MNTLSAPKPTVSIYPLPTVWHDSDFRPEPPVQAGWQRSIVQLISSPSLGITNVVSAYLHENGASICYCTERHYRSGVYGGQFIYDAPEEVAGRIDRGVLEERGARCLPFSRSGTKNYLLKVIAPDRLGIVSILSEVLLKRKIAILSHDLETFVAPLSPLVEDQSEHASVANIDMVIGLPNPQVLPKEHDIALDELQDGLEYLEHRFSWFIRLEERTRSSKARRRETKLVQGNSRSRPLPRFPQNQLFHRN